VQLGRAASVVSLPTSHGCQIVVKTSEIPTRVVDRCELHFREEGGTIPDLVVPPGLDPEKEFVEAFRRRILEALQLGVGVWFYPWVI
jgi:hypothetical protein